MSSPQNYRMTNQRLVILQELRKSTTHPTPDEVFSRVRRILPHISLGTVYRNLEILSQMGLISKLDLAGSQKRFDGQTDKHYHICCIECNRIDDIPVDSVEKKVKFVSGNMKGYTSITESLTFKGICKECAARKINGLNH